LHVSYQLNLKMVWSNAGFQHFTKKNGHSNRHGIPPGWSGVLRKLWGLEMLADMGGVEGFGGFVGAGIFFAFGKIGQLGWLLAVAKAGETALEWHATTLRRFAVRIAGQGGGGRTAHGGNATCITPTAANHCGCQRLPHGLRAENSKLNG
jgi:hypothetical protein